MTPLISIIIPAYNVEKYLPECLDSVTHQNFDPIEIITINDASPDASQNVIDAYAQKDARILSVVHDTNKGTLEARRTGVLHAKGLYCLFLDGDDTLKPGSLKALARSIAKHSPDFIQYEMHSSLWGGYPYYKTPLQGKAVFETLFVHNTYVSWSAGGKCLSTALLKQIFKDAPQGRATHSEDFLIHYMAAYSAQKYVFCKGAVYKYRTHEESAGSVNLNKPEKWRLWIEGLTHIYRSLDDFKQNHNIAQQYPSIRNEQYNDYWIVRMFMEKMSRSRQTERFQKFCDVLSAERIFDVLSQYYPREGILHLIPDYKHQKIRPIKNIGFISEKMGGGGVERMTSLLADVFQNRGYSITILTEKSPSVSDFQVSPKIRRETLNMRSRYSSLNHYIRSNGIDAVIIQDYWRPISCWDLFYLRMRGGICVINSLHNFALWADYQCPNEVMVYHSFYPCAHVMTVLSQRDKRYLELFVDIPVIYMPNLMTFDPAHCRATSLEDGYVLFIGKLDFQKNPEFIIRVFPTVVRKYNNATLHILGSGESEARCKNLVKKLKLSSHIFFEGYQTDILPYLARASLLILPSHFEGFPLVVAEALSHGIPVVMSQMDYNELSYCEGVISVEKGSESLFADSVTELLSDRERLLTLSKAAKSSIKQFDNIQTSQRWEMLLKGLGDGALPSRLTAGNLSITDAEIRGLYHREALYALSLAQPEIRRPQESILIGMKGLKVRIKRGLAACIKAFIAYSVPKGSLRREWVKRTITQFKQGLRL